MKKDIVKYKDLLTILSKQSKTFVTPEEYNNEQQNIIIDFENEHFVIVTDLSFALYDNITFKNCNRLEFYRCYISALNKVSFSNIDRLLLKDCTILLEDHNNIVFDNANYQMNNCILNIEH